MFKLINYFKESAAELGKIKWPNRQVTMRLTLAVVIFSTVLATFMTVIDLGLSNLVKRLLL